VVIDRDAQSFERLGRTFNGMTLVGSGFDWELLKTAGAEKANALCAVTNGDNTNLVTAQVAKKIFKIGKVIARVYDPGRANIYRALGLDIISGTILVAAMVRDKIVESKLSSYLIESGELGVLEIPVDKDLQGKLVNQINIAGELIVVTVRRKKEVIIPESSTKLEAGDILMAVVKTASLAHIKKVFKLEE
jgi:trk system potassium uptake protein TrkA